MKQLLIIDSLDLAAVKDHVGIPFLEDKLIEAEVELNTAAMVAILDMVEAHVEATKYFKEEEDEGFEF